MVESYTGEMQQREGETFPVRIHQAVFPTDPLGIPISKVLHVSAVRRWLIVLLLLEHGVATEWIQAFVPERTSSVNDVVIDHFGVALGTLLTWPWWGRTRS